MNLDMCPYCEDAPASDKFMGYCSDECQDKDFDNRTESMLDPEF